MPRDHSLLDFNWCVRDMSNMHQIHPGALTLAAATDLLVPILLQAAGSFAHISYVGGHIVQLHIEHCHLSFQL